jgi:hypothetical protein
MFTVFSKIPDTKPIVPSNSISDSISNCERLNIPGVEKPKRQQKGERK